MQKMNGKPSADARETSNKRSVREPRMPGLSARLGVRVVYTSAAERIPDVVYLCCLHFSYASTQQREASPFHRGSSQFGIGGNGRVNLEGRNLQATEIVNIRQSDELCMDLRSTYRDENRIKP